MKLKIDCQSNKFIVINGVKRIWVIIYKTEIVYFNEVTLNEESLTTRRRKMLKKRWLNDIFMKSKHKFVIVRI